MARPMTGHERDCNLAAVALVEAAIRGDRAGMLAVAGSLDLRTARGVAVVMAFLTSGVLLGSVDRDELLERLAAERQRTLEPPVT